MARDEPQINIRLSQELKDRITEGAKKRRRSVNAEIVDLLEEHYPEPISIEETAADIQRSIGWIRSVRGHEMFRVLAEQVDQLLADVLDKGLLSPEAQEEAKNAIRENMQKRWNRNPPFDSGDF